jgi:hypothetical protein
LFAVTVESRALAVETEAGGSKRGRSTSGTAGPEAKRLLVEERIVLQSSIPTQLSYTSSVLSDVPSSGLITGNHDNSLAILRASKPRK